MYFAFIFLLLLTVALADIKRYYGYKVFAVTPENERQTLLLKSLEFKEIYNFWSQVRKSGHASTVMISPNEEEHFRAILETYGIPYQILITDVEAVIENERINKARTSRIEDGTISFLAYNMLPEIEAYLYKLAIDYKDVATLNFLGYSYEEQPIYALKISASGVTDKPIILVDAGIHGREWIAPAVALYIIQQLVENKDNRDLIENIEWHIIPSLNPDGYRFSYSNDRFWRKTRSPGTSCIGVDGNRNFDFHWLEIGASTNECSETYAGPQPFSELETVALRNYVLSLGSCLKLYLSFHSQGKYLLYPWGYTSALPEDADELDALGNRVADAIYAYNGTEYTVGSSTNALYPAAGGSDDWVKGVGGVALSYTIELPGGGSSGFDPPTSNILPVVKETFVGVREFHAYIKEKFATKSN